MRRASLAILLLAATPAVVLAQSVKPGDRVRVTAPPDFIPYEGTLRTLTPDTLTVDTLRLSAASVTGVEVYRGRKSNTWKGIGFGFAVGAVSGVIIALQMDRLCYASTTGDCLGLKPEEVALVGATLGAIGGLVGAFVGALIKSDRWEEAPLDQLRVNVAPQRDGGFAFGLSVAF